MLRACRPWNICCDAVRCGYNGDSPFATRNSFSSIISHHRFLQKMKRSCCGKRMVSYDTRGLSTHICCRTWLLREWNLPRNCRWSLHYLSIEQTLTRFSWLKTNFINFPIFKDFHYKHIPRKWPLRASRARNVCYDAVCPGYIGESPLTTKILSPQYPMISFFLRNMNSSAFKKI